MGFTVVMNLHQRNSSCLKAPVILLKLHFFIFLFFFAHVNNEYALQPSALVDRGNPAEATHQEDGGNHPSVQRGKT